MRKQLILLIGFLVNVSASMQLYQWPRFVGVKSGSGTSLSCKSFDGTDLTKVEWLKAPSASDQPVLVRDERFHFNQGKGWITLTKLEPADSGIYFCRVKGTTGPGSELQVHRPRDLESAIRRSNMKDVIIFLQAFLLGIFLLIPQLFYKEPKEKEETVYEEPEDDHTYEGLDIEQCGLYEDIPAFSQQDGEGGTDADAEPFVMESPDQE